MVADHDEILWIHPHQQSNTGLSGAAAFIHDHRVGVERLGTVFFPLAQQPPGTSDGAEHNETAAQHLLLATIGDRLHLHAIIRNTTRMHVLGSMSGIPYRC